MKVAFTLIRKPFLENLLIFEQLLTEEQEFLEKFESDSKNFDPGKINAIKKKELIENSLNQISNNFLLSSFATSPTPLGAGINTILTEPDLPSDLNGIE